VLRRKTRQIFPLVAATLLSTVTVCNAAASEDSALCPDLLYLIEQSESEFSAIREDTKSEFGGYDAALVLSGASYCTILEDAEKASYRCVWTYPRGDEQAHTTFQRLATEMRACIGTRAEEQTDQSVNHPDFYASQRPEPASPSRTRAISGAPWCPSASMGAPERTDFSAPLLTRPFGRQPGSAV
jgi:hypothetical protein